MSQEANKAIVRRFFALQDEGAERAAIKAIVEPDFIAHMPRSDTDMEGAEALVEQLLREESAFPDLYHDIEEMVGEGDSVAVRLTVRGTHKGDFGGIAPTGKKVVISVTGIFHLSEGKVVECWFDYDALGLMQQVGAID